MNNLEVQVGDQFPHVGNLNLILTVREVFRGRWGEWFTFQNPGGEWLAGQVDVVGGRQVALGLNLYGYETEAVRYAIRESGADEDPFCRYGCTDYHLADCPVVTG